MMRATLFGLLVTLAAPARAQQSVDLRFAPVLGVRVHRVFQHHTRLTVRDDSGTATREAVELGGVTQVAMTGPTGRPVVHVAVDSLRRRVRAGGEPWRELPRDSLGHGWLQARVSERLEVERIETGGVVGTAALLELLTGVPDLVFPDHPVRAGEGWSVSHRVPLGGSVSAVSDQLRRSLAARTAVTVDSVVARANDTLAYLSLRGTLGPEQARTPTIGEYRGGISGTLVWSSGWRGFVSGATRLRVRIVPPGEDGTPQRARELMLETTVRHQIRSD